MLTERADILVEGISLSDPNSVPHSHILVRIKNFGRTRAEGIHIEFSWGTNMSPVAEIIPLDGIVLGAGAGQNTRSRHTILDHVGDDITKLMAGTLQLNARGRVTYTDIFGKSHALSFGGALHPPNIFVVTENKAD